MLPHQNVNFVHTEIMFNMPTFVLPMNSNRTWHTVEAQIFQDDWLTIQINKVMGQCHRKWASQVALVVKNLPANEGDAKDTG